MANILYFSHGGGPLPILGEPGHREMIAFMKQLPNTLQRPEAIVVISAHWEEPAPLIIGSAAPELLYDYHGFPKETYELQYAAPDNTGLAAKLQHLFDESMLNAFITDHRGLDHGVFIPLLMMYPEANIPVTQISLLKGLDPAQHLLLGNVLRPLLNENVLIIGSGFSFHNMRAFDWSSSNTPDDKNDAFQDWLIDICTGAHEQPYREAQLIGWEEAPYARYCHPREEHLMPLHVCCGAAGSKGKLIFDNYILGKRALAFLW